MNACRARLLRSRFCRNWSLSGDSPAASKWLDCCESEVMDAGSLREIPNTACSGVYPFTLDSAFFAEKH
jgi:hypothetical protein